ncbi:hypothetical protein ACX0G9_04345 [Flavitalea flava]
MTKTNFFGWLIWFSLLLSSMEGLKAQIWKRIGDDSTAFSLMPGYRGINLIMDTTGVPYLFYSDATASGASSARRYNGSSWVQLGTPGFSNPSSGQAAEALVAGKVFMGITASGGNVPLVYSYNGTDWSQVGSPVAQGVASYQSPGLALDGSGTPYYAVYNGNTTSPSVFKFDGTNWVELGAGELGDGQGGQFVELAFDHNNTPYILYDDFNSNPDQGYFLFVAKYNGTHWVKLGTTALYSTNSIHALAFDSKNTPIVLCSTGIISNGANAKLVKLSGTDWVDASSPIFPTGGVPGGTSGGAATAGGYSKTELYLAIGEADMPVIAYLQDIYLPSLLDPNSSATGAAKILVNKYDGIQWVSVSDTAVFTPHNLDGNGNPEQPDNTAMGFAANARGDIYVSYSLNHVMHIYKLAPALPAATISFADVKMTYGDADLAPGATSTNTDAAIPITYAIADTAIAKVLNGKIHIKKAGSTTITASQAGNTNYGAATPVVVNLVINKAAQTISFPTLADKALADPDYSPGATASSGLTVSYISSDPSIATPVNGKIHLTGGGTVTITAQQTGDVNYLPATDVSHPLTVVAIVTGQIVWSDIVKNYGDADFDPGATSNNPQKMDFVIADVTVAEILAGRIHILKAGHTTISVSQPADASHTATSATINLDVYPVQQVIQFPAIPLKTALDGDFPGGAVSGYGMPFTASGLTVSYLSSDPTVAVINDGIIHILKSGTTIITAQQGGSEDFLAAPAVSNTLFVVKDTQSIVFPAMNARMLGDTDFNPGATASSGLLITYTISDPAIASIVNGQLHLKHTGVVQITASQPGNEKYQQADDVYQVLTINPGPDKPFPSGDSLVAYCSSATTLQVNVYASTDQRANLQVFDLYGHQLFNKEVSLSGQATNQFIIPVGNAASGIYTVRVAGQNIRVTQKVKINK